MQLLRVCLALVSGVAVANGKLVTENPFTINAACSQLGEEPAGLSGDLPAGYVAYACSSYTLILLKAFSKSQSHHLFGRGHVLQVRLRVLRKNRFCGAMEHLSWLPVR
jgi:hypothetical protein